TTWPSTPRWCGPSSRRWPKVQSWRRNSSGRNEPERRKGSSTPKIVQANNARGACRARRKRKETMMAVATSVLDLELLTGTGVVKCRANPRDGRAEVVGTGLDDENIRSVIRDPFNPQHLYACSVTDVY